MIREGLLLAIDQGTTNTKAILVGRDGQPVFVASAATELLQPKPDFVEQDPLAIWESVLKATAACIKHAGPKGIVAVGLSNQRETVVAWERRTGKPVAPAIIWQCRRSAAICADLERNGRGKMLRERTGLGIDPLFSASKVQWLMENMPGLRERAEAGEICFGTIDSWLIWNLTGGKIFACDASNASRTQLFNLQIGDWDSGLLQLFGVPRVALPKIKDSSGLFGECSGIAGLEGVPILSAMGDSHAALAGHGAYAPGTVKATYGTGSSVMTLLPKFRLPQSGVATTVAWQLHGQPRFALEGNISMTGSAVQWVGEFLGMPDPVSDTVNLAATVEDSAGVYFVPAMVGLGAPYWDTEARGVLMGLGRSSRAAHMARAAIEAIAFQIRDVFDVMESEAGCALPVLYADGGGTRNDWLMQFQTDMLGRPVLRSQQEELSALGAAWMAGLALGWWQSPIELENLRGNSTQFVPKMVDTQREQHYAAWKDAVARTRYRPRSKEQAE
jgi:glycerol kinase